MEKKFHPEDCLPFRNASQQLNTWPKYRELPDNQYNLLLLSKDGRFVIEGPISVWMTKKQTDLICRLLNKEASFIELAQSGEFPEDFFDKGFYVHYWNSVMHDSPVDERAGIGFAIFSDIADTLNGNAAVIAEWLTCTLNGDNYDLMIAEREQRRLIDTDEAPDEDFEPYIEGTNPYNEDEDAFIIAEEMLTVDGGNFNETDIKDN